VRQLMLVVGVTLSMSDSGTVYSALKASFLLFATGLSIVGQTATVLGWGTVNDQGVFATSLRGVEVCSLNISDTKEILTINVHVL
jgi:hypothetical protein